MLINQDSIKVKKIKLILSQLLLVCFFFINPAFAATPWVLDADRVVSTEDEDIIEAHGNVHLFRLDNYLQADYARLYTETNWLYLKGNISARWDGDFLEGDEAELDLDNNVGWIKNGQVFMSEEHIYFSGQRLEKTGENTYSFTRGTMTSCDGETPPWSIKSSRGKITVDGYASLWNPRFRVRDQSVLYSPYIIVPVKTERQSGFLFPNLSHSSEMGTNINLPYYHVIDDQRDATLYTNYYSKRGLMLGLEYRHTPSLLNKGLWRADWMRDRERHDTVENEPSRFHDDGLFRPNKDRYWLRAKYDGYAPRAGWSYKVDIDYVSDQNYLREFKSGHSGFNTSRNQFLDKFGRDLEDYDSLIRTNIVSAAKYWSNVGLDARLTYSDNLRYRNSNLPSSLNPTIQKLPEINLNLFRTGIGNTPFEIEATNQATYFWREYGTRGTRLDVHPRLSTPLRNSFGTLTPSIGWRQTAYYIDQFENDPAGRNTDDNLQTRGMYDININAFTNIFKVFDLNSMPDMSPENVGKTRWTKVKHSIRPEIDYDFIPEVSQDKYPRFDSVDRISPREELTYSLANVFTNRTDTVIQGAETSDPSIRTRYRDFLRIKFEQAYDFREARRREDIDQYSQRPFSDLLTEITVNPNNYLSLRNKTWYSFYESMVTEHEHTLTMTWPEKVSAWFSLDFLNEIDEFKRRINSKTSILELGTTLDFVKNWQVTFVYRRDLEEKKDIERSLSLTYRHQCYNLQFIFEKTDYDHRYEVRINLLNLGSIGG